jgi:hypothetical protein
MRLKIYPLTLSLLFVVCIGCKKDHKVIPELDVDVYVAGSMLTKNNVEVAAYWKNGVLIELADSSATSRATAIAISGADVYVSGLYSRRSNIMEK